MLQSAGRRGLSMLELLTILAVLAFLAALALPFLGRLRGQADRTLSQNNLRQLAIAVHSIHDVHNQLPPAVGKLGPMEGSLHFHMLPFVDQAPLHRRATAKGDATLVADALIPVFLDPADTSAPRDYRHDGWLAATNYAGNWLVLKDGNRRFADVTDGTSNTLLFATRYRKCGEAPCAWGYYGRHTWAPMIGFFSQARFQIAPHQATCAPALAQTLDRDAMLIGLLDGSTRTVRTDLSARTWGLLLNPSDGQPLGEDFQ